MGGTHSSLVVDPTMYSPKRQRGGSVHLYAVLPFLQREGKTFLRSSLAQ